MQIDKIHNSVPYLIDGTYAFLFYFIFVLNLVMSIFWGSNLSAIALLMCFKYVQSPSLTRRYPKYFVLLQKVSGVSKIQAEVLQRCFLLLTLYLIILVRHGLVQIPQSILLSYIFSDFIYDIKKFKIEQVHFGSSDL